MTPHDLNIEAQILGSLLLYAEAQGIVFAILAPEDFYNSLHQRYYATLLDMFEAGEPIEPESFQNKLRTGGVDDTNVPSLTVSGCTASSVEYNARLIKQFSILRQLIVVGMGITNEAKDISSDPFEIMQAVETRIMELSGVLTKKSPVQLGKITKPVIKILDEIRAGTRKGYGLQTGFSKLDEYTGGFEGGDFIVIGGRPSQGKSAYAFTIAKNIAKTATVAFFSLEMGNRSLILRSLAEDTNLEHYRLRTGRINDSEYELVKKAQERRSKLPLFIDDTPGLSLLELKAKSKRLMSEHGLKCIMVDYLQLMTAPKIKGGNREQEVSMLSAGLKMLAKELDIPVVGLVSMNRQAAQTASKRPELHQLRESGAIESDADMVILIHRPSFYGDDKMSDGTPSHGKAEIILAKQRNGRTGMFELAFIEESVSFRDLSNREMPPSDREEKIF